MATKQQGQIRKRGDGVYQVRVYRGKDAAGKRYWATETIRGTKRDAQKALTARLHAKDAGRLPATTRETVETYLLRWLESGRDRVRPRTLESYSRLLKAYVIPALGTRRLASLNGLELQEFVRALSDRGLGARTVRYTVTVFRQALRQAVRWRLLPVNPVEANDLTLPRQERKERRWLSPAEASKLLVTAEGHRLAALWHVAIMTALRPGEYLALMWPDVDLSAGTLTVRRVLLPGGIFGEPKTKQSRRTVTLPVSTVRALREHKRRQAEERLAAGNQWQDSGLVFCTALGRPLDHNNLVHYHFKPLLTRAELPAIRLYDLRHTGATLLLEAGENLKVVSERLGHASIILTADTYSHVSPTMQARAAERLETLLASSLG
ncbi:MAG: tyrosine-type recombinase/integrase [Gemmatimonadales bacterium]